MAGRNYVYGSAARQLPRETEKEFYVRSRSAREQERLERRAYHKKVYNAILIVTTVVALCFIIWHYINVQAEVTSLMNQKASLQSQYESLRLDNDLYEDRIYSAVNLQEIERIAAEELGMKLAGEGQIIIYSGEIEDYVKQYADMPE